MISITKEQIKRYFDKKIYQRGSDYFKNGKVSNVVLDNNTLTAEVGGSNLNVYGVSIVFTSLGVIDRIRCTCPYQIRCKHAAAALLYFSFFGPQKHNRPEVKNPLADQDHNKNETELIEINPANPDPRIFNLIRHIRPSAKKEASNAERRKAVILLDYDSLKLLYREKPGWKLIAGMQLIKKDGTIAKAEQYSAHKTITEPVDENIADLFEKLADSLDKGYKLEKLIDHIIRKKTPVHSAGGAENKILEYAEIKKMKLDFMPLRVSEDLKKIYFKAYITADFYHEQSAAFDHNVNIISGKEYFSLIDNDKYNILYFKKSGIPEPFFKMIHDVLSDDLFITASDISLLKDHINNNGFDKYIDINFDKTAIKLKKLTPKTVLEMDELGESSKISIIFEYEKTESIYSKNSSRFILGKEESSDNFIEIYQKDIKFENAVFDYIKSELENITADISSAYYGQHIDFTVRLGVRDFLIKYGMKFIEDGYELKLKNRKDKITKSRGRIKIKVTSDIDWFDIKAEINDGGKSAALDFNIEDIKNGIIKSGGQFMILSKEDIIQLEKLTTAGMDSEGRLRVNKLHFNAVDILYDELISQDGNNEMQKTKEIINRLKNFEKIEKQKIPENFNGTLRDYQYEGFNWLFFLNQYEINGCLADDMGLGKTVQTLCLMQKLKEKKKLGKVLLIAPVSTIPNWESEINRFTPDLSSIRHIGTDRTKETSNFKKKDIIITSYHTFRNDIEFFKSIEFSYLILDEAQNIKNASSQTFKAVKLINAKHRLSLTGTPVENSSVELWSQMDFLNHGILGSIQKYKSEFALQIEKHSNPEASARLKSIVKPFILRRKKEDVAKDLPDKEEIIYLCEMDERQKAFYDAVKKTYYEKMSEEIESRGIEKSAMTFFEGLLRLRQAALFPGIINAKHENIPSCKNEALRGIIEEIISEDHKTLIFSQFVETLKRIQTDFNAASYEYAYLDGSTKDRDKQIKKFQEDDNVKLFLLSLKAGGVGINLTKADYVILFDPWWNPAVENQAVDRAHRIGQKNKVIVYKLIVKDTVEEKILKLQDKKKKLVSDLINEESAFYKSLTKDDMLNLFK